MANISLRIAVVEDNLIKTIKFSPDTTIADACRIVHDKVPKTNLGPPEDYGLFRPDDFNKGMWLEPGRNLDYYVLKSDDELEYKKKIRTLKVKMLDGTQKTILVDDTLSISNLMDVICKKIGIIHHDEYGLLLEDLDNQENQESIANYGTMTLKRKKEGKDVKMEQLRKKLNTDEINWIDSTKTLYEQGIDESKVVILKRKYFFSDQNIDSRDPVQLNLLYVQARDTILKGTNPVTQEDACKFAGIQCQIQYGDHVESKHKSGFLELKDFLPQSYIKVKNMEKKIFAEHKKHQGVSEIDAKVMYTKIARALETYGVTFFLVKEKMKGKNKLVPRLLGITKDSVLRLDAKTKEIQKTWPLTTVRRWGASPNTFTLDFGDYADQHYSVQTTEGEQISHLIEGYIDIILKNKQTKDHFGIEGDEGSAMIEESISPLRATILQQGQPSKVDKVNTESIAKPAVIRYGCNESGSNAVVTGSISTTQYTMISGQVNLAHTPSSEQGTKLVSVLSEPQKALMEIITAGKDALSRSEIELETKEDLIEIGNDLASKKWKQTTLDTSKQMVSSQLAVMNAATAKVVNLTSPECAERCRRDVGNAIITISSNFPEMTKEVKTIAALMEDCSSGDKLINATKKLCCAFTDLLKTAEPEIREPRQYLLNAASEVGEASHHVLYAIGEETEESKDLHDNLLALAKLVANLTAVLVQKARNIASACETPHDQNKVIACATQCALSTSELVACAKVVAPTLLISDDCQNQMCMAAADTLNTIDDLVDFCNQVCYDDALSYHLQSAACDLSRALDDLMKHVLSATLEKPAIQEFNVETILSTTDKLFASTGNSTEMLKQASVLGQATAQLIQGIKKEAEQYPDTELKIKLLAAAKTLADATAKMVEAARICANQPNDINRQNDLRKAAEELRDITNIAVLTPAIRHKLITKLHQSVRQTVAIGIKCLSGAHSSAQWNQSQSTREGLEESCKCLAEHMSALITAIKQFEMNKNNTSAQLYLVDESEQFLQPATHLVQSARAVLPTLTNQNMSQELSTIIQQLAASLSDLKVILYRAKMASHADGLDAAIHIVTNLKEDLNECFDEVENGELKPLPGDSLEKSSQQLGAYSKAVGHKIAQMLSAVQQSNDTYTVQAARDTAYNLKSFAIAVRGVAATTPDIDVKKRIILGAQDVMINSLRLIEEAKTGINHSNEKVYDNLSNIAKDVTTCLNRCINCLPGQRDIDQAISQIKEMNVCSDNRPMTSLNKSYGELQQELNMAATKLNDASTKVVSSIHNVFEVANVSKNLSNLLKELRVVGLEIAAQTKDPAVGNKIVGCIKNISTESIKLLATAKSVSADLSLPNGKNQLAATARAITDNINQLVDVCTSTAPGQKECENAIRKIQAMKPILDNPNASINDTKYYECLETVIENSKSFAEGMPKITNFAKQSDYAAFEDAFKGVSFAFCNLIEASAQAAFLIGVSDSSSIISKPGLVDQTHFARIIQDIQTGCQNLINPLSGQKEIITAAELIAKRTSALCSVCRVASSKTTDPVAKIQFIQSVKEVANTTSALVKEIKSYDSNKPQISREKCQLAIKPLLEAVDKLSAFAGSPEYASVPAKISQKARNAQEPIIESGYKIIDESCALIDAIKSLVLSPRDPRTWQLLANHSQNVSDSIKILANSIQKKAPGKIECETAIKTLESLLHKLNNTTMEIVSEPLTISGSDSIQGYFNQIQQSSAEILDKLEPVRQASKHETENIGHSVSEMLQYYDPLVTACIATVLNMIQSNEQILILNQSKSVIESTLQFIKLCQDCSGNSKAVNLHSKIDSSVKQTRDMLNELTYHIDQLSTQTGVVTGVIEVISRAMTRLTDHRVSLMSNFDMSEGYVDYQTRMVANLKEIAKLSQELSSKSSSDSSKLGPLSAALSHHYANLANDSIGASASVNNGEVSTTLRNVVETLGSACIALVTTAGQCHISKDRAAFRNMDESSRIVVEKVSQVLATLQLGARGTQACINAVSTVSGIIGDLDTTIMFATAGTLHADNENHTFSDYRENILKTAKALVEDTKTLVAGAASSQEQLAVAAQNAVATIVKLAAVVKDGAASLGANNPDSQVMLINAVKDVASGLGDLIQTTKAASGKPINDPAMVHLKESAKVMVTNVTSLLKTVKAVEDEHTRGTRALESTIEAISQEIRNLSNDDCCKSDVTVEELVRCARAITQATVKAVAAGNSNKQDDIISSANMGRKAVSDMLIIAKANAVIHSETAETRQQCLETAKKTAETYKKLLEAILYGNSNESKQVFQSISREIAQCVTELISIAEILNGIDWVRPDDSVIVAENELLGAAASIDAAVQKLSVIKPREIVQENEESYDCSNFDEMILESAKSIAKLTSALVMAASVAQKELIETGKVSRQPLTSSDDGQWSEGLISAAKMVAAATHSLVESANALIQGDSSEEKLVSSAKQVASSTAQLLVACKVKADSNSESMKKLQMAGNSVVKSTEELVRGVQNILKHEEQRSLILNRKIVGGIAQEIDARSEVFRIEKQLVEARGKLQAIRQAKYKLRGPDFSGDEIDLNDSNTTNCDSNSTSRFACEQGRGQGQGQGQGDVNLLQNRTNYIQLKSPEKVNTLDRKRHEQRTLQLNVPDDGASCESYMTDCSVTSDYSSKFHYTTADTKPRLNGHPNLSYFRTSTPVKNNGSNQMFSCTTNYNEYSNESDSDSTCTFKKKVVSRSETNCSSSTTTTNYYNSYHSYRPSD